MKSSSDYPALGIDLATRAGFAIRFGQADVLRKGLNHSLVSGAVDLSVITPGAATKTRPADHPGEKFNKYRSWLVETVETHGVARIYYERPVGGIGGAKALNAFGFEAITLEVASLYDLPVSGFHVNTIKKFATGSGKASKDKTPMIEAALAKFPGQEWIDRNPTKGKPWTIDDNQADALHVLHCGLAADSIL